MPSITAACYGKDNVRLLKKSIDPSGIHTVTELTVRVLLEGALDVAYTHGDNAPVVATDTIKNTILVLARKHAVAPPEAFAARLAAHFPARYRHIRVARARVHVRRWGRIVLDDDDDNNNGDPHPHPHPHSFIHEGNEKRTVEACAEGSIDQEGPGQDGSYYISNDSDSDGYASVCRISISSGIVDLSVLKTTGSAFYGFLRDEFTTLPETRDRILSTDVTASWDWIPWTSLDAVDGAAAKGIFDDAYEAARRITLRRFAQDNSASVQATMYKMAHQVLEAVPSILKVNYSLPNNHYFELDLSWYKDLKNTGKDAQVYIPQASPNGLIQVQVSREGPQSQTSSSS